MRGWKLTWGEHEWTDDTVPSAVLAVVVDIADDSWQMLSPWSSPKALVAWLVALVATVKPGDPGERLAAAMAEVYSAPMGAVIDALADRVDPEPAPAVT